MIIRDPSSHVASQSFNTNQRSLSYETLRSYPGGMLTVTVTYGYDHHADFGRQSRELIWLLFIPADRKTTRSYEALSLEGIEGLAQIPSP